MRILKVISIDLRAPLEARWEHELADLALQLVPGKPTFSKRTPSAVNGWVEWLREHRKAHT